jgi:uncharacterized protein with HEPN domain
MIRDYSLYLQDIKKAVLNIFKFTEGMTYKAFDSDEKTQSAVIRQIEIMGEATNNIPDHIMKKYPELPWSEMARTRDKFIHGYFDLNNEIIWKLIKE